MLSKIRAILRAIVLFFTITAYLTPVLLRQLFFGQNLESALETRFRLVKVINKILGVKIEKKGTPTEHVAIFVGNHRSYFDPIVTLGDIKAIPIAKSEVSKWPFIGGAARATGIIFVKRESHSSRRRTLDALFEVIQSGRSVLIYPEGTTGPVGTKSLKFQKGAFRLAASEKIPVVPIAIDYLTPDDAWINDDTFIPHFFKCFGKPKTYISIHYGEPIVESDSEILISKTKSWIDQQLVEMQKEWSNSSSTLQ